MGEVSAHRGTNYYSKTRLPKLHEFTNNLIIIILADVKLTNLQKQARVADTIVKKDV